MYRKTKDKQVFTGLGNGVARVKPWLKKEKPANEATSQFSGGDTWHGWGQGQQRHSMCRARLGAALAAVTVTVGGVEPSSSSSGWSRLSVAQRHSGSRDHSKRHAAVRSGPGWWRGAEPSSSGQQSPSTGEQGVHIQSKWQAKKAGSEGRSWLPPGGRQERHHFVSAHRS